MWMKYFVSPFYFHFFFGGTQAWLFGTREGCGLEWPRVGFLLVLPYCAGSVV